MCGQCCCLFLERDSDVDASTSELSQLLQRLGELARLCCNPLVLQGKAELFGEGAVNEG